MEIILILILVIIGVLVFVFNGKKTQEKPSFEKRSELINDYEQQLQELINKYQNNPEKLKVKKIEFLKNTSKELHNNIFFDESEAKKVIQKLASM